MTATTDAPALERALALLADPPSVPEIVDGYLDLLGDAPSGAQTLGQRFMTSRLLPLIYERVWRPIGFRLAFGTAGVASPLEDKATYELLELGPEDTVLDVACGPGNISRRLLTRLGPDGLLVGIDASPTMLARAVIDTDISNAAYVRGDAQQLPFRDAVFDAVCCYAALYLMARPFDAIDEMVRVLKPGGRIAVLTSVHRGPSLTLPLARAVTLPSGVRVFSRDEITGAFEANGLIDVRQRVTGLAQFVGARARARRD
ncbi:MAG TPA: methyltransferase domain-containing protein [Solirubrobacteraceae bacterium]|jgi:SAM-dependent methyltransferase|nr:methyltransferase domain-containing protein [Solirubrobacteraceae bacterium]